MPDLAPADRRAPVARWMMTFAEPLLSTERRILLDADMAAFCAANIEWATCWFTGYLTDVASTLPPEDPWRHLSATLHLAVRSPTVQDVRSERISFDNPEGAPAPRDTGAVLPDGRPFGATSDSADLLTADIGPPSSDIGLVALTEPLGPVAAALAGFATADTDTFHSALMAYWRQLQADGAENGDGRADPGVRFLGAVAPVLRRFIHRRRIYTGPDDPFPLVAGFAWLARADRLLAGSGGPIAELGLAAEGALRPGTYDDVRL